MASILGAVLAGGQSRRFGSDKALAIYDGHPLLEHVIIALRPQTDALVVCGRDIVAGEWPGVEAIADRPAPGLGPLGGLNAALHYAVLRGFSHVLSAGCDTPGLPADLLVRLTGPTPRFVRDLPIVGLWPVELAGALDDHLATAGDRSIGRWASSVEAEAIELADPPANINAPGDLRRLNARYAAEDGAGPSWKHVRPG